MLRLPLAILLAAMLTVGTSRPLGAIPLATPCDAMFAELIALIGTSVGTCIGGVYDDPKGYLAQQTTMGTLALQLSTGYIGFVGAESTLVIGPCGLQGRPANGYRFAWEGRSRSCIPGVVRNDLNPPSEPLINLSEFSSADPAPAELRAPGSFPCADGQVKGNRRSMIYHVRGQNWYAVTGSGATSDVECFWSEAEARAAGYRRALN